MRGSHPGSFEAAHALRDGAPARRRHSTAAKATISSWWAAASAGWPRRTSSCSATLRAARVLMLDNHDDFGGHAKRNEFARRRRPAARSTAARSRSTARVPTARWPTACCGNSASTSMRCERKIEHRKFYAGLGPAARHLLRSRDLRRRPAGGWPAAPADRRRFCARAAVRARARADLVRIERARSTICRAYRPTQKKDAAVPHQLPRFPARPGPGRPGGRSLTTSRARTMSGRSASTRYRRSIAGRSACPASSGLKLPGGSIARMGYTPAGLQGHRRLGGTAFPRRQRHHRAPAGARADSRGPARDAAPRTSSARASTTRAGPAGRAGAPAPQQHRGARAHSRATGQRARSRGALRTRRPELQCARPRLRAGLLEHDDSVSGARSCRQPQKQPCTSWSSRRWSTPAWRCATGRPSAPGVSDASTRRVATTPTLHAESQGRHRRLSQPARRPMQPMLLRMVRVPCKPGLPRARAEQGGRAELLATPFATFEHNIRDQLARMLAPAASIRPATSTPSPSTAGRTATHPNTTRCWIRTCRRSNAPTSSAARRSAASRLPIRIRALPPTPIQPSTRLIARSTSCCACTASSRALAPHRRPRARAPPRAAWPGRPPAAYVEPASPPRR